MSKKTLLQIITHHRQNPLDFIYMLVYFLIITVTEVERHKSLMVYDSTTGHGHPVPQKWVKFANK
jgi:hypothetical protein